MCLKKLCLHWGVCLLDDDKVPAAFLLDFDKFSQYQRGSVKPSLSSCACFPPSSSVSRWSSTQGCCWSWGWHKQLYLGATCFAPGTCVFGQGWAAGVECNNQHILTPGLLSGRLISLCKWVLCSVFQGKVFELLVAQWTGYSKYLSRPMHLQVAQEQVLP